MSKAKAQAQEIFKKNCVIIVGEGAQSQLFKVLEEFNGKDENGTIKAALLKETLRGDNIVQFHVDKPVEVPIADKPKRVFNAKVIDSKGKGWEKQPETIEINQFQLQQLVNQKKGGQALINFSDQSAEEKKHQQVERQSHNKKVKKAVLQTQQEDPKSIRRKGGKRYSSQEKSSELSDDSLQSSKIQAIQMKRGRKPSTQAVKEEPQKIEKKVARQTKKNQKQQLRNLGLIPGESNSNYQHEILRHEQLESTIPEFKDHQSVQINNKEIIRAAYTQNLKLLEDVLSKKYKISTLFERWGPENNFNALELMFQKEDVEMVKYCCQRFKERQIDFTTIPQCSFKVTTKIGSRQENNALVLDLAQEQTLQETIKNLLRNPKIKNVGLFDKLLVMDTHLRHQILEQIPIAVRAGNCRVAKHLVEKALKEAGNTYGYNQLHLDCLGDKKKLKNIKYADCTKKLAGKLQVTPIHMAAINSDPSYLKKILKISEEYNISDELGRKPIHYAAVSNDDKCLKYLLDKGANPKEKDKLNYTPLMLAAQFGKLNCLKTLLSKNFNNREGNAAIHLAAQYGNLECLKELIGKYKLRQRQNRCQPIHLAAAYGHFEIVKYLKEEAKANINSKDKYGRTPLAMAARNGNLQILSYLLKNGADYRINDSSGNTPMHYAAAYGFAECLLELKIAGADQNINNSWHLTPLGVALAKNHYSIVKEILNFPETDVNCKDDEGKTLLISSLLKFQLESLDYIIFLVEEKNAIVTEEDQLKKTALHYAVQLSAKTYKRTIFQYNSMPKKKRQEHKQHYREAILELVKLFISRGGSINAPDSLGVTPFMTAIKERQTDLIQYFLQKCEPDFRVRDGSDKNLLHIMIDNKSFLHPIRDKIFKTILQKVEKDQIIGVDEQGFSPLVYMIKEFTSSTTQLYNKHLQQILLKAQLAKMEEHLQNIDPNELAQYNQNLFGQNLSQDDEENSQDDDEEEIDEEQDIEEDEIDEDESEEEESDEKEDQDQDFRKVAPRYRKAPQQIQQLIGGGFTPQFQGELIGQQVEIRTYGQFSFNIGNNQTKTIGFTHKEYKEFQDQAMIETLEQEDKVLDLIMQFLDNGASLNEYVRKNKQYRKHNPKRVVVENPYNGESKKQIQHYIFQNFPNKQFLQNLQNQLGGFLLNFNNKSEHGQTPLHLFCLNPANQNIYNSLGALTLRQEFLKYLLDELNVNIDIQDKQGRSATHILAVSFEEPLLDLLLAKGGKLNVVSKDNVVPIIHHVNRQDVQTVTKLLAKGADPNFQDINKRSSLHHAINISNQSTDASFDMQELLFEKGAKADIKDIFDRTPLYYCFVKIGTEHDRSPIDPNETVSSLLAQNTCYGNVYDIFKRTPLHYAAMRDSVYSASYLINQNKFELDGQDIDGNTPIALAFLCGHQNFVKTMIDSKAQITRQAIQNDRKKIELDYIKGYKEKDNVSVVNLEIDNPVGGNQSRRPAKAPGFGGFGQQQEKFVQDVSGGISFPTKFSYIPVANNIQPGKFTFFKLAITHGWQNVAFLLILSGFDLFIALEDSLKSQQFQLVKRLLSKAREEQVRDKKNDSGQNLFHLFAQFGLSAEKHIYDQILLQLETKLIPYNSQDNLKRTPLHYASMIGFDNLINYLLDKKTSPNDVDSEQNTPYSYALQRDYRSVLNKFSFPKWQAAGFDIKSKFKVIKKKYQLDTFMFLIQEKQVEDELFLDALLQKGSDINSLNQEEETAIFLSVRANNETLFKFLLQKTKEAKKAQQFNINHETIYHVVVQPFPYGSFENTFMLRQLIDGLYFGSVNSTDNYKRSPLDYALRQKTGKMAALLKSAGGFEKTIVNLTPPAIESAKYPDKKFPQFQQDAKEYIEENQNAREQDESIIDTRLEVDPQAKQKAGKYEIVIENGLPYSLIMTKVDLANGLASQNDYYKMQLIHETNKDIYILFTRWGRIGTPGQLQITPFDKPNAIKEYHSIFTSKSGNIWEEIVAGKPFEKQPKKYQLQNLSIKKCNKQLMKPFDFSKNDHDLEKNVARFLLQFCQVKLYQRELQQIRVDHEFLPFESLEKQQLYQAKNILKELEQFVLELEKERKERKEHQHNDKKILQLFASINQKSSRYYDLIPCIDYRTEPLPPLETLQQIRSQSMIVETLLNLEVTSKILLGALKNAQSQNPLTYCLKCMQIRVQTLVKEQPEYQMVQTYVKVTSGVKISNIFAVERRNETERFNARFSNLSKQLLWHGSKTSNYMAILTQGLKIAPPWAYATGSMFGKGIYFADTFEKSYAQTQDYTLTLNRQYNNQQNQTFDDEEQNEIQRYRYLLLCEVATGKMKELREPTNVENFAESYHGFDSIKGCGRSIPDPKQQVILEDGTILPQGKIIQIKPQHNKDIYYLGHNEYIIYNEEQVRIRYLVQIDTQSQEDEFL